MFDEVISLRCSCAGPVCEPGASAKIWGGVRLFLSTGELAEAG